MTNYKLKQTLRTEDEILLQNGIPEKQVEKSHREGHRVIVITKDGKKYSRWLKNHVI